jgi:hypothetical protein
VAKLAKTSRAAGRSYESSRAMSSESAGRHSGRE